MYDIVSIDSSNFIGREIGNFTILKEIGRGGKGIVFLAFQKSLKRNVVVKILPKLYHTTEEEQQEFRDEAEIIAILSHPNIIPIFEMGEVKEFYFQVMQLINGSDLKKIIKNYLKHPVSKKRVIPKAKTIDIIIQILEGLGYAHEEGIVHQDIKPSNILMEWHTKRPLIADFGIAKAAQLEYKNQRETIIGSPAYLSPEQATIRETDKRTDIYSLGTIFFEMLAGKLPRRRESIEQILIRKIQKPDTYFTLSPSQASPLIDNELERIILKAVEADLDKRYRDCYHFKDELIWYRDKYLK